MPGPLQALDPQVAALVEEANAATLRSALVTAGGNQSAAAKALGISLATLKRRVASLNLAQWLREKYPNTAVQRSRRASEGTTQRRAGASPRRAEVQKLIDDGLSRAEAGRALGISRQRIGDILDGKKVTSKG